MSTVVNRVSFEVIHDANTPDYDPASWLVNPNMSAVQGVDKKYWFVRGNELHAMEPEARVKIDDADLAGTKRAFIAEAEALLAEMLAEGFEFPAGTGERISLSNDDRMMLQGIIALGMESVEYPISIRKEGGGFRRLLSKNDVASLIQSDIIHRLHLKKQIDNFRTKVEESLSADEIRKVVEDGRV